MDLPSVTVDGVRIVLRGNVDLPDEIGALNFLTSAEVLRGIRAVQQGKVFALGVPVARPGGDPIYPGRGQPT